MGRIGENKRAPGRLVMSKTAGWKGANPTNLGATINDGPPTVNTGPAPLPSAPGFLLSGQLWQYRT